MANPAIKRANKKYRHEQRRKHKARAEKMKGVKQLEARAARKHKQLDYIRRLGAELEA